MENDFSQLEPIICTLNQLNGDLQINLIAPPTYVMTTTTLERDGGIAKLQEANDLIKEAIEKSKGSFKVKMEVGVF